MCFSSIVNFPPFLSLDTYVTSYINNDYRSTNHFLRKDMLSMTNKTCTIFKCFKNNNNYCLKDNQNPYMSCQLSHQICMKNTESYYSINFCFIGGWLSYGWISSSWIFHANRMYWKYFHIFFFGWMKFSLLFTIQSYHLYINIFTKLKKKTFLKKKNTSSSKCLECCNFSTSPSITLKI